MSAQAHFEAALAGGAPLPSLAVVAEYAGKLIKHCRFNKLRIAECYGWNKTMAIWNQPIINSGSY